MDSIKVISLNRSIERRLNFRQINTQSNFIFIDAVDGLDLSAAEIEEKKLFQKNLPYTPGAYGCALSHLNLWEESITHNRVMTIAEDDAIFRLDFEEKNSQLIDTLPSNWDIVLWGWNFDSILSLNVMPNISPVVMLFNQDQMRASVDAFKASTDTPKLFRLDKCFGMPSYSISPSGARKFKSLCFPLENFNLFFPLLNRSLPNNGLDIAMNRIYSSTNSYACFPPLVITKNEHPISTIQT